MNFVFIRNMIIAGPAADCGAVTCAWERAGSVRFWISDEGDELMPKMSRIFAVVMMAGFVAGCAAATTTVWKKTNVKKAQMEMDLKTCSAKAGLLFEKTGYKGGPVAKSSQTSYESYMGEPFEKCMTRIGYKKGK